MNITNEQTTKVEMVKFLEDLRNRCTHHPNYQCDVEPITTVIGFLKSDIKKGRHLYCSISGVMFSVYQRAIKANP